MADVGQRVVRDLRNALFRHIARPVGGVLFPPHVGAVGLAHHQRRQPGPDGGLGDGGGPDSRVAGRRRLRRVALLLDWRLALVCPDGRAARRLSAGAARPARAARRRGAARKSSSTSRTSRPRSYRPPDRQGVRRRGRGRPRFGRATRSAVPHEHEDHGRAVGAAAADGVHRRHRGGGALWYGAGRIRADGSRRATSRRFSRPRS